MTDAIIPLDDARRGRGAPARPLAVMTFADIKPRLESNSLVKGWLGAGAMSIIYGDSNTGKSFLAIDLALHIALGWEWQGKRIRRGGVLYVAGEGASGVQNRVAAFRQHHNIAAEEDVPFAIVTSTVDLRNQDSDTSRLIATVIDTAEAFDCPIALIIVDTLARALAGGDENASQDMGAFVANIDRIRQATTAHVCTIHHTGKDQSRGARGHSSLRAAIDTEIEVSRDQQSGVSTATATKQRDLPLDDAPISFTLHSIELGTDEDGDPMTSCVIQGTEAPAKAKRNTTGMTAGGKIALAALQHIMDETGQQAPPLPEYPTGARVVTQDAWRKASIARQITDSDSPNTERTAFRRAAENLMSLGLVGKHENFVWLIK
jgi:hypothetical protein